MKETRERKEKTTMKTTTTDNPFKTLINTYNANPTDATALENLATAVTYSVLKKCIDTSNNPTLVTVRQSIARDKANLNGLTYANANAYEITYNSNGDRERKIKNKDLSNALTKLCKETLGDGIDLVNDAVVAILSEVKKQKEREPEEVTDLERPYTIRRLRRKVWIKSAESVNGWETVNTTPIQEVYKAVRRAIDQNRAVQTDPRNGYTYLADLSKDTESDTDAVIYQRFGKYADIGGYVTDYNGKITFYTADEKTVKDIDIIVESLNLTAKQAKVLQLRQSGYGYKAIATYLGITQRAVAKTVKAIQTKAVAIGLKPDTDDITTD